MHAPRMIAVLTAVTVGCLAAAVLFLAFGARR
jgi:hypothetical protein